jgi:hypothetical protein
MKPEEAVTRLKEMRTEVVREMPHVGCCPPSVLNDPLATKCTCYKCGLVAALFRAEIVLRDALGMPPF